VSKWLLPLLLPILNSCAVAFGGSASVKVSPRVEGKIEIGDVTGKKNGPEKPGRSNTKSTEDFSDPQKDGAPKKDAD